LYNSGAGITQQLYNLAKYGRNEEKEMLADVILTVVLMIGVSCIYLSFQKAGLVKKFGRGMRVYGRTVDRMYLESLKEENPPAARKDYAEFYLVYLDRFEAVKAKKHKAGTELALCIVFALVATAVIVWFTFN
jgi:hypothetical protein